MAQGAQPAALGDRPLKVAVIGAGFVSPFHIAGWQAQSGVSVVALSALDQAQADERAWTFAIPNVFWCLEAMLDAERLDVLDICTPPAAHRAQILCAARRGIHVMCQKPLAPSLEDARAIARDAAGIRIMVHENFRFRPWYREVGRQLRSGIIGDPFYYRSDGRTAGTVLTEANPHVPYSVARQPYYASAKPLLLIDYVIHQIDTCRFLLGEPASVYGRARRISDHIVGEDLVTLHLTFPGVEAVIEACFASRGYGDPMTSEALAIEGSRGTIFVERDGTVRTEVDVPGDRHTERVRFDSQRAYAESYAATIAHFVTCLRDGRPFETGIGDNLKTLEVLFAAYRSIDTGEAIGLEMDR